MLPRLKKKSHISCIRVVVELFYNHQHKADGFWCPQSVREVWYSCRRFQTQFIQSPARPPPTALFSCPEKKDQRALGHVEGPAGTYLLPCSVKAQGFCRDAGELPFFVERVSWAICTPWRHAFLQVHILVTYNITLFFLMAASFFFFSLNH